jgi:HK97 family phage prohead protease
VIDPIPAVASRPDGTLILRGYGSTFFEDRDHDVVTPDALRGAVGKFLENPVLLLQHNPEKVIGRVTSAVVDQVGLLVEAEVPPPPPGSEPWHVKAYSDIRNGLLRAFSIGGWFRRAKNLITSMDLLELSVVSIPSNAAALFQLTTKAYRPLRPQPGLSAGQARLLMTAVRDLDTAMSQLDLEIMGRRYRADLSRRRLRAFQTR